MNEKRTNNETAFESLSVREILWLASSEYMDDNQLALRLVKRIALAEKAYRVLLTSAECDELNDLGEVTDRDLANLPKRDWNSVDETDCGREGAVRDSESERF